MFCVGVACRSNCVVCCIVFAGCCRLFVACCLMFAGVHVSVFVVCWLWVAVCVVRCVLRVVYNVLFVV